MTTDLKALADVLAWFDQFQEPVMPHMTWLECQLALAEGFTNAVRHAHSDKSEETPIEIKAQVTEDQIDLRIWDYGPGFEFDEYLDRASQMVDKHAEGGRGLGLIKQIADVIEYVPEADHRNCLHIVKRYLNDSPSEPSTQNKPSVL
ncbi:MAG: ATP-binding protein [Cyanobacteria bacterium P01_F01_bin.150]